MSRGVGVTANNSHPRLGQPQLRTDYVHDSLVSIPQGVQADPELFSIFPQSPNLGSRGLVFNRQINIHRGGVVILGGNREVGTAHFSARHPQPREGLGAGDFMA